LAIRDAFAEAKAKKTPSASTAAQAGRRGQVVEPGREIPLRAGRLVQGDTGSLAETGLFVRGDLSDQETSSTLGN
jgi:hypothetical protein